MLPDRQSPPESGRQLFVRLHAIGPEEKVHGMKAALDDFLVDGDWPDEIEWVLVGGYADEEESRRFRIEQERNW